MKYKGLPILDKGLSFYSFPVSFTISKPLIWHELLKIYVEHLYYMLNFTQMISTPNV